MLKNVVNFEENKGDIMERYLFTKFGVNPLDGFPENGFNGMTVGCVTLDLMYSYIKQS